jgi:hypothetical protein
MAEFGQPRLVTATSRLTPAHALLLPGPRQRGEMATTVLTATAMSYETDFIGRGRVSHRVGTHYGQATEKTPAD